MQRRTLFAAIILASLRPFVPMALGARMAASPDKPKVGAAVPDFGFNDLAGHAHRLSDFAGRYVLLDFWATWCVPCIHDFPTLQRAAQEFHSRGLVILGLDSDQEAATARTFVRKNQIPWLVASPQSTKVVITTCLNVQWYPALVLVGPDRKILMVSGNGGKTLGGKKFLEELNRLLPQPPATTAPR